MFKAIRHYRLEQKARNAALKEKRLKEIADRGPAKQIIVVRKDLNMRKGKIAAQVAHASLGALLKDSETKYIPNEFGNPNHSKSQKIISYYSGTPMYEWLENKFTKICVYVNTEQELLDLEKVVREAGLRHCLIKDAGDTEFHGVPTYTTLAIGPAWSSSLKPITGHLPLL